VTEDQHGNLVVSDFGDQFVRVLAGHTGTFYGRSMSAGRLYNVAGTGSYGDSGDGGPATKAAVGEPLGLAVDPAGNLVFATVDVVRVVAETTGTFYGRQMTAGDIYTIAGGAGGSGSCDGGPGSSAGLNSPSGVAVDAAGNALVSVYPARVCVIAGATGTSYGQHMTAGDIYTVAGDGTAGFAGDGGPATAAEIDQPAGLGVDSHGNILMTDTGNQRVRVVAGSTGTFYGVPMTAGDIYTVAGDGTDGYAGDGGPATSAEFSLVSGISFMSGVTADSNGNLIISDSNNDRVRVVPSVSGTYYGVPMTAGDIYTVAGNGASASFSGDGGPATKAAVREPDGVAVTSAGDLVVADTNNDRVRLVTGWPGAGRQ
jgi:hypothetical protein